MISKINIFKQKLLFDIYILNKSLAGEIRTFQ